MTTRAARLNSLGVNPASAQHWELEAAHDSATSVTQNGKLTCHFLLSAILRGETQYKHFLSSFGQSSKHAAEVRGQHVGWDGVRVDWTKSLYN